MEHYAGIDVSLELSSVCVVDGQGKIVKEAKVASEPEALVCFFKGLGFPVKRIGLEAGPLSQWLHAGLVQAGYLTSPGPLQKGVYSLNEQIGGPLSGANRSGFDPEPT